MNNLGYVVKASGLPEEQAKCLLTSYKSKQAFLTNENLHGVDLNDLVVKGYYYVSKDTDSEKYTISDLGIDIMEKAIDLYVESLGPKPERPVVCRKREIHSNMEEAKDIAVKIIESKFAIKDVKVDRSNYLIRLEKRTHSVRNFEIMNKGIFRIFSYKMDPKMIKKFEKIGMEVKKGAANVYLDIDCTEENIKKVIELFN